MTLVVDYYPLRLSFIQSCTRTSTHTFNHTHTHTRTHSLLSIWSVCIYIHRQLHETTTQFSSVQFIVIATNMCMCMCSFFYAAFIFFCVVWFPNTFEAFLTVYPIRSFFKHYIFQTLTEEGRESRSVQFKDSIDVYSTNKARFIINVPNLHGIEHSTKARDI